MRAAWVSADSWYDSIENLKFLRNKEVCFLVGLEANRIVSTTPGFYEQVGQIEHLPPEGLLTLLKGFDFVKVFTHVRHYAMYLPDREECSQISRKQFQQVKAQHWHIEKCFRTIKQQCHAQDFFVRTTKANSEPYLLCTPGFSKAHLDGAGSNTEKCLCPST